MIPKGDIGDLKKGAGVALRLAPYCAPEPGLPEAIKEAVFRGKSSELDFLERLRAWKWSELCVSHEYT